jgi:serine phosphatase RsbU (regulator of sigma subunit)
MFVTQGPVNPESRLFTGRTAELMRMERWVANADCVGAVLGARQTGKTSLLLKLRHTLKDKYAFVFVDLEAVAQGDVTECLTFIAGEIAAQLGAGPGTLTPGILRQRTEFLAFLEACARSAGRVRIVVLLDEIGALMPETALRLSSIIRAVFTTRHVKPEFARYVFVLAGATDMLELTTGRNSPLKNVADSIYLGDLSELETEQLVAEMFGQRTAPDAAEIYPALRDWTAGHPYWTQMLGEALGRAAVTLTEGTVRSVVENLLQTEDRNLPHVFDALNTDGALTQLVEALLAGTPISFTRAHRSIAKLELIGLLKNDKGRCSIRNRIYRTALEQHPVRRPRAAGRDLQRFSQHLAGCRDSTSLLCTAGAQLQSMLQTFSVISFLKLPGSSGFSLVSTIGIGQDEALPFDASSSLAGVTTVVADADRVALRESDRQLLKGLGIRLVVPVSVKEEPAAFFWLGPKLSGDEYDEDDREFLAAVAEHTAGALDRLRLHVLEHDAEKASQIQQGLLPRTLPSLPDLQIAASYRPARLVGGDYYDVLKLGERRLAVCIADVMGKGIPAALMMANLQAAVRQLAGTAESPSALCGSVNRLVAANVAPGQFITFFYAVIDIAERRVSYAAAGHNPPILVRGGGAVERLSDGGPPLGLFPDWQHTDQNVAFEPGDRLLLFTDGVSELRGPNGDEFGEERLMEIARTSMDAPLLHQRVLEALQSFSGGAIQDDVTLVALSLDAAAAV